jgi:Xaa-Pro aminopeptidase
MAEEKKTMTVSVEAFEAMQRQMAEMSGEVQRLKANAPDKTEEAINLLVEQYTDRNYNVYVFSKNDKTYLFTGYKQVRTANGQFMSNWRTSYDESRKRQNFGCSPTAYEINDMKVVGKEVTFENEDYETFFHSLQDIKITIPKEQALFKNESYNPKNQTVELTTYTEKAGSYGEAYISQQSSGIMVQMNTMIQTFVIKTDYFGKEVVITSDAINCK